MCDSEETFLKAYSGLLDDSPPAQDREIGEEPAQDLPTTAEVAVADDQARPFPEEDVLEEMDVDMKVEPSGEPEPVLDGLNLSRFGDHYKKALRRLLNNHEPFIGLGKPTEKPIKWSYAMKEKCLEQFREASKLAIEEMMVAIYLDRNITFREAPDCGSPVKPLDPVVGEKVAQQAAIAKPINTRCACATVHRSIFTCPIGARDHPQLCQTVVNMRRALEEPAKPPISLRKADASAVGPIPKKPPQPTEPTPTPSPSFKKPSEPGDRPAKAQPKKRGRDNSKGRNKNRDQSKDSRPNKKKWRSGSKDKHPAQQRIDRARERAQGSAEASAPVLPGPGTFTKEQLDDLVATVKAATTSKAPTTPQGPKRPQPSSTAPAPPKPSQHGEKVIYRADGTIDWRYAPITPTDLPPDRDFEAIDRNGHWCCRVFQK
jgi:hypothetical protein